MCTDNQRLIDELKSLIDKPGGKQAARFVLNSMGSIPGIGGVIAGAGNLTGEMEQQDFNEKITEWASSTNESIEHILVHLASQLQEPTKAHMSLLLAEVLGAELPENGPFQIRLMLNPETIRELKVYEKKGWLNLTSNGCNAPMGSGNIAGGCVEEKKNPWGMGSGFNLVIDDSYYS